MSVEGYLYAILCQFLMPADALSLEATATDATADKVVVCIVDNDLGIVEQLQLLHAFLLQRTEVLLMGSPQRCQHANGGLNDVGQSLHLAWLADTCFNECHVGLLIEQPD